MKKNIRILSRLGIVGLLLSAIFFGFADSREAAFSPQVSGQDLIKAAFNQFDDGNDDLLLIGEVVQTKYGETATSVSVQGNLSGVERGKVYLGDYSFDVERGGLYWSTVDNAGRTDEMLGRFGTENAFAIDGEPIARGLYVPAPVRIEFRNGRDFEFSRAEGLDFTWNADERNEYPLFVVLQHASDDGKNLLTKQFRFNDAEASGRIRPDDLRDIPEGGRLVLFAGRGNGATVEVRGRATRLAGLSITSVPGLVLR